MLRNELLWLICYSAHQATSERWSTIKKKDLTILGGKSFPFRIDLFSEVGQNFDSATSPESVTIRLKRTMVYSP